MSHIFEVWPVTRHLREFFALLYNRQPTTPADINARVKFKSAHDPTMAEQESIWESGIREYIRGVGVPRLAQWLDIGVERIDFSHVAGRATQVLKAMTGSDLMPATDDWFLTVSISLISCMWLTIHSLNLLWVLAPPLRSTVIVAQPRFMM
jgi:hypothetical protein